MTATLVPIHSPPGWRERRGNFRGGQHQGSVPVQPYSYPVLYCVVAVHGGGVLTAMFTRGAYTPRIVQSGCVVLTFTPFQALSGC